jgi:uncharacterized RDD family membrane protein YckC
MNNKQRIYVTYNNKQYGPMSWDKYLRYNFPPHAYIWYEGLTDWQRISSITPNRPVESSMNRLSGPEPNIDNRLFANFGLRLAAYLADAVALGIISFIIGAIWGLIAVQMMDLDPVAYIAISYLIGLVTAWLYFAFFESGEYQATPGKMLLKIKVVDMHFNRITFANASGRFFSKILSGMILFIGFLMVIWTPYKQGLHDQVARTFVIKKEI